MPCSLLLALGKRDLIILFVETTAWQTVSIPLQPDRRMMTLVIKWIESYWQIKTNSLRMFKSTQRVRINLVRQLFCRLVDALLAMPQAGWEQNDVTPFDVYIVQPTAAIRPFPESLLQPEALVLLEMDWTDGLCQWWKRWQKHHI